MSGAERAVLEDDDELADEGGQHGRERLGQLDRAKGLPGVRPMDSPASDWPFGREYTPERSSSAMTEPL